MSGGLIDTTTAADAPDLRSSTALLALLAAWAEQGWLRPLDVALARFVAAHDPAPSPVLLLATALVSQLEGQGHACLPLHALAADAAGLLGWGPDAADATTTSLAPMALLAALPAPADWPAAWIRAPAPALLHASRRHCDLGG